MKFCNKCVIPQIAETNTYNEEDTCFVCKQIKVKLEINVKDRVKKSDIF